MLKCLGFLLALLLSTPSAFAVASDRLYKWVQANSEKYSPGDSIDVTQFLEIELGPGQTEDPSSHHRHERATVLHYDGQTMTYKNRAGVVKTIYVNPVEDYPGQRQKSFTFESREVGRVHVSKEVSEQTRIRWSGGWLGIIPDKPTEVTLKRGDVSTDLYSRLFRARMVVENIYAVGTIYMRSTSGEFAIVVDAPNDDDLDEYRFRSPSQPLVLAGCAGRM